MDGAQLLDAARALHSPGRRTMHHIRLTCSTHFAVTVLPRGFACRRPNTYRICISYGAAAVRDNYTRFMTKEDLGGMSNFFVSVLVN